MNIAIASSGLGHVVRGIEIWAEALASAIDARGLPVCLYKGGGTQQASFEQVIPCWPRHSRKTQRLLKYLPRRGFWRFGLSTPHGVEQATFTPGLIRRLRRDDIDVLHVQDPLLARNVQKARRMGLVKTRVILGHGTVEPLEFLKTIDYLQHLAPWHLDEAKAAGVWKPTWTAIPNFVDTERFRPGQNAALRRELAIPEDAIVVLTSAAIDRRVKRIDYLIDEFAALLGSMPAYLIIAGGVEADSPQLIEYGKAKLGDRVRFMTNVPAAKMPLIYPVADLFTLCSFKEMMPVAMIEAMSCGLPCITHHHPVLEWVAGPGGQTIDMAVPGTLAASLSTLLQNPARRRTLGTAARQHCLENFGKERVLQQILDYYHFILTHDKKNASRDATARERAPA